MSRIFFFYKIRFILPVTAPSPATQSKNAASQTSEHGAVIRKWKVVRAWTGSKPKHNGYKKL